MSAVFLIAGAAFHLLMPERARALFEQPSAVRVVGVALCALGAASFLALGIVARLAALVVLVSGLRRAIAPERMIDTMQWASRPVHGVLILVGAVLLVAAAVWSGKVEKRGRT
jgi:hypothetical protein